MFALQREIAESFRQLFVKMAAGQGVDPGQLPDLTLEIPPPGVDGDFAASYPLKVARLFRQPPRSLARQAADLFRHELVGSCEVAGPGFINIFLVEDWPRLTVPRIMATKDQRLCPEIGEERPVLVEYVSANPTGPLHIGHGRGAAYGSALVNLLSAAGYRVSSEHYLNDCGNQILNLARSVNARYLQALGVEAEMPADGYYGDDIAELAGRIVKESGDKFLSLPEDERIELFQRLAVSEKIKALKDDLAKFNVRFDNWFRESDLHERGEVMDVCRELQAAGFTYEKDGATWLRTTDFGDDKDRVLLRESGMPTYFAADLAYHRDKLRRGFDRIINIWGADHHGYVCRMLAGLEAMTARKDLLQVILLQMVHLYRGGELVKISKRTGQLVTLSELIDEVGRDAARYFLIMRAPDSQLDFDIDLAVSRSNENPVYYVQYAHARICSIERSLAGLGRQLLPVEMIDFGCLTGESEKQLLKKIMTFDNEIAWAAREYAPHRVANFVYELAGMFHSFYNQHRIIGSPDNLLNARWHLVLLVRDVLRRGLDILAIDAPEQM